MTALLASCLIAAATAAEPAEIRARFIGNMALQHRDHFLASLAKPLCQKIIGPADVTAALPGRGLARQGDELVFRKE